MDYNEFKDAMAHLEWAAYKLEEAYTENEGEVTEETELLEDEIASLKTLLTTEGVDFLGRWLKAKEDAKKALKAEKDYVSKKIEAVDGTIAFIKEKITQVMGETNTEKLKGSLGYSFALTTSKKTEVDKDLLNELYMEKVREALWDVIPEDVTITLGASISKVEEGREIPIYYKLSETPTVRFTKPRAKKEE